MVIVFTSFIILIVASLFIQPLLFSKRNLSDWNIDILGLLFQGIIIPLFQTIIIYKFLHLLAPHLKAYLQLSPVNSFLLNFVFVDYLYYWNHRFLHNKNLWKWHCVHHTSTKMDVLVTSRNTIWANFLIVYVWFNGIFIFLLADPKFFIIGASLTAALDLWKHSPVRLPKSNLLHKLMAVFLITPYEHEWHHSKTKMTHNFGANLTLWDKLHGTYYLSNKSPESIGIFTADSLVEKLFNPSGRTAS